MPRTERSPRPYLFDRSSYKSLRPNTSNAPATLETRLNSRNLATVMPRQYSEFLYAVAEKDVTALTESQSQGRMRPRPRIRRRASTDDNLPKSEVLMRKMCRMQQKATYTDIGDAVTATVKCASKRERLSVLILESVAIRVGMVCENRRKIGVETSGDQATRNAV